MPMPAAPPGPALFRRVTILINAAHGLTHYSLLILPTAVLTMVTQGRGFGTDYGPILEMATGGERVAPLPRDGEFKAGIECVFARPEEEAPVAALDGALPRELEPGVGASRCHQPVDRLQVGETDLPQVAAPLQEGPPVQTKPQAARLQGERSGVQHDLQTVAGGQTPEGGLG